MRQVMHGDVVAAARALLPLPVARRRAELDWLIARAEAADRFRKRLGRAHPDWGNGSLMGAAMRGPLPPEPHLSDPDYLDCLAEVIAALVARRRR
ncbi:DUF7742 family protein [Phaeovulum sp. W22_SRMD_FR3]|jgi:hypothetical protein|uniref:DUF7742 family protein n=1 Tax=Phaeovulum sp. W22_SRMD_FR3 TaxID=3240274 RepID=UPI003F9B4F93